ncbi:MAG: phosphatase PAP2 family protein [Marinilabiliaceae bacterium]|nr:phosphatase PAP2 family protein [Marinilabiliaceae bacterium]
MKRCTILLILFVSVVSRVFSNQPEIFNDSTIQRTRLPHWTFFVGMAGATGMALFADENVSKFMNNNQTDFWKGFCKISDLGGEKKVIIPGLILTYGTSYLLKNEKLQITTEASIKSAIASFLVTETLKQSFGRARPYMELGAFHSRPFPILVDDYKSMPSGHTSVAFAIFTPFAENYSRWIYVIPVAVAFGRVYQNKHWVSDVIAGSGIGFLSGYFFTYGRKQIEIIPNGLKVWF